MEHQVHQVVVPGCPLEERCFRKENKIRHRLKGRACQALEIRPAEELAERELVIEINVAEIPAQEVEGQQSVEEKDARPCHSRDEEPFDFLRKRDIHDFTFEGRWTGKHF